MLNMLIFQVMAEIQESRAELEARMVELSESFDDEQEYGLHAFLMQQQTVLYEPLIKLYLKEKQLQELKASCTDNYLQKILKGESLYRMHPPGKMEARQ